MNSVHLKVVFTTLQFTSYRCYGEEYQSKSQAEDWKAEIEHDMQRSRHHSHHKVTDRTEQTWLGVDLILQ
jgi:hypothetical protein